MGNLTDKQKECFIIINLFIKEKKKIPTVREIAREMRLGSSATVYHHMMELKKKGYIDWIKGKARTIILK